MTKSDEQLQRDVLDELRWDARVKVGEIAVAVVGGVVTLAGTVDAWAERVVAQESAHRVDGVLDVVNLLEVRVPGSDGHDDLSIAHAVRSALESNPLVPSAAIRSTVTRGVVTLEGTVDDGRQRDEVDRALRNIRGLRELNDRILLRVTHLSPSLLRVRIDEALSRHAARASRSVEISLRDDTVVLAGNVPSHAERSLIIGAARDTPGTLDVDADHLTVVSPDQGSVE